jgi:integrase
MAQFIKRGSKWQVRVRVDGVDRAKTFRTKADAQLWAAQTETGIATGQLGRIPDQSFGDLLIRYRDTVSVHKDGARWETVRINRLLKSDELVAVRLKNLGPESFAAWRDRRLAEVSAATVNREWNLLSAACNRAAAEWRWLNQNPMSSVQRPRKTPPRTRRISFDDIDRIILATGYSEDETPWTRSARVGACFLFAIETAMRAGEICALQWRDLDLDKRIARIRAEDQGARKTRMARSVPLSSEAVRIIQQLIEVDEDTVFGMRPAVLSTLFGAARNRAELTDLHFHDCRAEALTRLSKRLDLMQLARVSGHRDLKLLHAVYYRESVEDMVGLLD